MKTKRVYIAGPMRGYPHFNFPAFDKAEQDWRAWGWDVINPAEMDRQLDLFDEYGVTDVTNPPKPFAHYMRRDIEALLKCDAIALLPGWRKSTGARLETMIALALGLEVFYAVEHGQKLDPETPAALGNEQEEDTLKRWLDGGVR